ncbi:MAG: hypothetical protein IJS08_15745 [Victivallales bacterium]|nr:hypothetical protein [Victivallales bacterium]
MLEKEDERMDAGVDDIRAICGIYGCCVFLDNLIRNLKDDDEDSEAAKWRKDLEERKAGMDTLIQMFSEVLLMKSADVLSAADGLARDCLKHFKVQMKLVETKEE